MKRRNVCVLAAGVALMCGLAASVSAAPLASPITYQGELNLAGAPVNNTADFRFQLFDAAVGGNVESAVIPANNVQVVDGVFTVSLDFGFDVFQADEQRFVQIQVRSPAGAGAFTNLNPRQALTPSPIASAARRGFVPWVVQTPGTDESVTISPDLGTGGFLMNVVRDGASVVSIEQSGATGGGVYRATNEGTGALTAFWGTSFLDQSGYGVLGSKDHPFAYPLEFEADVDGADNGLAQGQIRIRSVGTGGLGGSLLLQNNEGVRTFEAVGGADDAGAIINLFDPVTSNAILNIAPNAGTPGTQLFGFSPDGLEQYRLEPDNSTDGGGFLVVDSGTAPGAGNFVVDGNFGNSGSPLLRMTGASDFSVNCEQTGDASVVTPNNAISATETLDEPGLASAQASSVVLTGVDASILSRTITVPAPGFVIAMAQGDIAVDHVAGTTSNIIWGVNDTAGTIPVNGDIQFQLPAALSTGTYDSSASAHAVFAVAAGAHTYHFNARAVGGIDATMFDVQLTLIYIPTAYGTTSPSLTFSGIHGDGDDAPPFMPLTAAEIVAERAEGEAFNNYRLQKEVTDLKAEMEALKAMLLNDPNMQPQAAPRRAPSTRTPADAQAEVGLNVQQAPVSK